MDDKRLRQQTIDGRAKLSWRRPVVTMTTDQLQNGGDPEQPNLNMMEDDDEMPSCRRLGMLHEREKLMQPFVPKRKGFMPRSNQQLASKRPPRSMLNVECSHLLRCSDDSIAHGHHPIMYTMWLEAGKQTPPYPERLDSNYNSNVWRNFRKSYGFHTNTKGQKVSEMIAQLYPLNLPPPSKVGDYTYPRFLSETPLIKDEKMRDIAIERTTQDILEFKRMRLRSEMRNPPLDEQGDIKPPINFARYTQRFVPVDEPAPLPEPQMKVDIFGNQVPVLNNNPREPFMWKVSWRLNHPEYEKVQEFKRQKMMEQERQHPPAIVKLPGRRSEVR